MKIHPFRRFPAASLASLRRLGFIAMTWAMSSCFGEHDNATGTVDDTHTGLARLYNTDGLPASGASIKVFKVSDSTKMPVARTVSNKDGYYRLEGLAVGRYNIYAVKDSLVAFQDSITVLPDTMLIEPDTLETPISISGVIGMQPDHDPRSATIQVLGTDLYSNVDSRGRFTLKNLASGRFRLKASTTEDNYTSTFMEISLTKDSPDTLADTLWLIYTGIPVARNISAEYDTLNGVVKLTWDSTDFRNFAGYLIYRDSASSLLPSTRPIGKTSYTSFSDTVYGKKSAWEGRFADSSIYNFRYRVRILDKAGDIGSSYEEYAISSVPPYFVKTNLGLELLPRKHSFDTTSEVEISVHAINPTRPILGLTCWDTRRNAPIDSFRFAGGTRQSEQTLGIPFEFDLHTSVKCTATDGAGSEWSDSLWLRAPGVSVGKDVTAEANEEFERLPATLNPIGPAHRFLARNLPPWCLLDSLTGRIHGKPLNRDVGVYPDIRLYVSDGRLLGEADPVSITVTAHPWLTLPPMSVVRMSHTSAALDGKIYVIGGHAKNVPSALRSVEVFDTTTNSWSNAADFPVAVNTVQAHSLGGKIYVISGSEIPGSRNPVYVYSPDSDSWEAKAPMPTARVKFTSSAIDGKIYVVAGWMPGQPRGSELTPALEVYDPVSDTWETKAPSGILCDLLTSSTLGNEMYVYVSEFFDGKIGRLKKYNPVDDAWSDLSAMPVWCSGATSAVAGGKLYMLGGTENGDHKKTVYAYDPAMDNWTRKTDMKSVRFLSSSVSVANRIFVFGGVDQNYDLSNTVEQYSPELDR